MFAHLQLISFVKMSFTFPCIKYLKLSYQNMILKYIWHPSRDKYIVNTQMQYLVKTLYQNTNSTNDKPDSSMLCTDEELRYLIVKRQDTDLRHSASVHTFISYLCICMIVLILFSRYKPLEEVKTNYKLVKVRKIK